MSYFASNISRALTALTKPFGQWGRVVDRTIFSGFPPASNPDPVDDDNGTRYFKIANNPYVKAGLNFRDISRLFVSAKGLEPDKNGAYFPPQLIYTDSSKRNDTHFDALAYQYDEQFDGGFAPILKSLQQPAMQYGRAIGEIDWQRDNDSLSARFIWSRDPEEYLFSPPNYKHGLYRKNSLYASATSGNLTRMPDGKFMVVTFDSLFNNPYGQSILRPLAEMTETWDDIYDAWRVGLIKSGYGSWVGEYGPELAGNKQNAIVERKLFRDQLAKIANGTHSIFDARNKIRAEKLQLEAQAFLDFHTSYVQAVSVLLTGSATALIEGKYGSYSKEESTSVRQKSDNEQSDALLMGMAFTYQFNRFFLTYNFGTFDAIPQLQLIRPELITPTTPEGQDTQTEEEREEIVVETGEETGEAAELAEGDEDEATPEEVTRTYSDFPSSEEEPDIYGTVVEEAQAYLEALPVQSYDDVTPREAPNTFTIKRLRNYPDNLEILKLLKNSIILTLTDRTEAEAWGNYLNSAELIFKSFGMNMQSSLVSDLIISFRQARQNAFQAGIDALIEENSDELYAIRIATMEDARVRPVHALWQGVTLRPDDPRLERLRCPMDFGCRCNQIPVFEDEKELYPLTPESDIPVVFPGESYRGYVA